MNYPITGFEAKPLQTLLKDACNDSDGSDREVRFNGPYSGRGMYGRNCPAVSGSIGDIQRLIADIVCAVTSDVREAAVTREDERSEAEALEVAKIIEYGDEIINSIMRFAWDSLGYDIVVYWKDIEWIQEEEHVQG